MPGRQQARALWPVAFVVGTILALALTFSSLAPLLLVAFLTVSIVTIVLLSQGSFDLLLCLVACAGFLLPMNNIRLTSSLSVGDGFLAIALVLVLVIRADQHSLQVAGMNGLLLGLMMIIAGGLVGSFFAVSPTASVAALGKFGGATIALPILFGLWQPPIPQLRVIAWAIVLGSSVSAVVGILSPRVFGRAEGLTNHPNHFGLASVMAIGVTLGLLLSTKPRGSRVILLIALMCLTFGVLLSGSRSALIAEILVVAVVGLLTHDRRIILTSLTAIVLLAILISFGQLGQHGSSAVARLLGGGGAGASDRFRADSLRSALHAISLHPFTGQGFQDAQVTHDNVLEVTASAGVLGILGFGLLSWFTVRPLWTRYRWGALRHQIQGDLLLIGAIASVLGFLANGIFAPQLYDRYIWIVITTAVALNWQLTKGNPPRAPLLYRRFVPMG